MSARGKLSVAMLGYGFMGQGTPLHFFSLRRIRENFSTAE